MFAMRMRGMLITGMALVCAGFVRIAMAGENGLGLSADDLADALGIHWWTVQLPADMPGTGTIVIQWISANGMGLTGQSASMTNKSMTAGAVIKIFCRDEPGGAALTIKTPGGDLSTTFPGISFTGATLGGLPDGSEAKSNDVVLKVVRRNPDGTLIVPPGNTLNPGDLGMRVVIRPGARN
jgi:hypothetical protein